MNYINYFVCPVVFFIWNTTQQNQQNDCAPSEDLDQPEHPPCLTKDFAVRLVGS